MGRISSVTTNILFLGLSSFVPKTTQSIKASAIIEMIYYHLIGEDYILVFEEFLHIINIFSLIICAEERTLF